MDHRKELEKIAVKIAALLKENDVFIWSDFDGELWIESRNIGLTGKVKLVNPED